VNEIVWENEKDREKKREESKDKEDRRRDEKIIWQKKSNRKKD
jgi:hypothetical protein